MVLNVSQVSRLFGSDIVLESATFAIERKAKVGLVGRNGCGKTTLLRIICGLDEPDSGGVHLARGARIGYLRQEDAVQKGRTVLEEAQSAQQDQLQLAARLKELEAKLEDSPTDEDLEEYALVHEHFLDSEGYAIDRDARLVLAKLGFCEEDFNKPTDVLSGGEKTRLALARILLEEPDLLVLDEPTNHVDLEATEWLERWIQTYHGAVLMVSHDRTFLENTAQKIVELADGKSKFYDAPFAKYLELKRQDQERTAKAAAQQAAQIEKLDEYVRRFMNSQRTAQARGRQKLMQRLVTDRIQTEQSERSMSASFKAQKRTGDLVFECKGLTVGYQATGPLLPPIDWTVRWGEKWGVVGQNGSGKSTLIKTLLGKIDPLAGTARIGSNVVCGHFAQDVAEIDTSKSPLDHLVWECGMDPGPARDLLARFLVTGDDVFRPIKTMSGGEKNKIVLASLTQLQPNVLVLDEPTNHLDMDSREALADVLRTYNGTLVLVSHDRWLLGQVTQCTLELRKDAVRVRLDPYLRSADRPATNAVPTKSEQPKAEMSPREISKEIERLVSIVSKLEDEAASIESETKALEKTLSDLPGGSDVWELSQRHGRLQEQLAATISAWEEQSVKLESLREQQGAGYSFRPSGN